MLLLKIFHAANPIDRSSACMHSECVQPCAHEIQNTWVTVSQFQLVLLKADATTDRFNSKELKENKVSTE